jgi:serine/threonine-protein kinase RsbW
MPLFRHLTGRCLPIGIGASVNRQVFLAIRVHERDGSDMWYVVDAIGVCLLFWIVDRLLARQPVMRIDKFVPSDTSLVDDAVGEITAALGSADAWGAAEADIEMIGLALREALVNAIVHGNRCDRRKKVSVSVAVNRKRDLLLSVRDSGAGFDPGSIADPTAAENVLIPHGRGIFLIRQLMDEVDFNFVHGGTEVRMRRRRYWTAC